MKSDSERYRAHRAQGWPTAVAGHNSWLPEIYEVGRMGRTHENGTQSGELAGSSPIQGSRAGDCGIGRNTNAFESILD
eukprot:gene11353-biopygen8733